MQATDSLEDGLVSLWLNDFLDLLQSLRRAFILLRLCLQVLCTGWSVVVCHLANLFLPDVLDDGNH